MERQPYHVEVVMKAIHRGFTLIELLVVIAIIAILAAILFPVFAKAKEAAKKAADVSNVKQCITAQLIYSTDNDDRFAGNTIPVGTNGNENIYWGINVPLGYRDDNAGERWGYSAAQMKGVAMWPLAIDPYLKTRELLASPVDVSPIGYDWDWTGVDECGRTNYIFNAGLMGASQTQVPEPASLVMYRTHGYSHRLPFANPHFYIWCLEVNSGNGFAEWTNSDPNDGWDKAFGNGGNVGWADGHAKFRKLGTLTWYEIGDTNSDKHNLLPMDEYWCMNMPWRGRPAF
jgi:prepilin-type N-terminal cleavage/methylation domain-containing protein/prepilin-type processing-associated H-X9-DG protein